MFEIENKSTNGQYQFLWDRKLRITLHRQNRKSWYRVSIPRHGPIFHFHIIKNMADEENTYMHLEEESIIYIWSKFQLDTCMFGINILLTKFGSGFWFRIPDIGSWFYSFLLKRRASFDINQSRSVFTSVNMSDKNTLISVSFARLGYVVMSFPAFGTLFAVVWSIIFDFEASTATHCRVTCLVFVYLHIHQWKTMTYSM